MRRREFIRLFTSAVVAWPLAARAQQQGIIPTVGILWHAGGVAEEAIFLTQIQQGLKDLGYVEGRNVTLVNTFAGEQYERFNSNAAELVRSKVDVIVAVTLSAALAAQRATNTIPIVFIVVPDPVATKLVASLAHPGGNITGLSTLAADLLAKRLELFKKIVAPLSGIALLVNPSNPIAAEGNIKQVTMAAERLGMTVQVIEATQPDQIERAFSFAELLEAAMHKLHGMPLFLSSEREAAASPALYSPNTRRRCSSRISAAMLVRDKADELGEWRYHRPCPRLSASRRPGRSKNARPVSS
jgi:putative ABC transport system substrate-binding protein